MIYENVKAVIVLLSDQMHLLRTSILLFSTLSQGQVRTGRLTQGKQQIYESPQVKEHI